jgi:hypothetical protein
MKITEFSIKNFKCFQDTGTISLAPGMNIVTGENNAGKTALLQALSLGFTGAAHLSIASMPQRGVAPNQISEITATLSISGNELLEMANAVPLVQVALPADYDGEFLREFGKRPAANTDGGHNSGLWRLLVESPDLQFRVLRQGCA